MQVLGSDGNQAGAHTEGQVCAAGNHRAGGGTARGKEVANGQAENSTSEGPIAGPGPTLFAQLGPGREMAGWQGGG